MKIFFFVGSVTILVALFFGYLFSIGRIRFNYPDKTEFPIWGIDISHHQGTIDWEELRQEKLSFVVIKATEGGDYIDPRFAENWANSNREGYRTGAYHFYRLCKDGKEQAANFVKTVPKTHDNLPPTVDLEFGGNCGTTKTKEQILSEVKEFLDVLENHFQEKPIIYVTREFYDAYLIKQLMDYPIWIRDIFKRPSLEKGREWSIWQFANRGHLKGIETYVDLNVWNGKSMDEDRKSSQ